MKVLFLAFLFIMALTSHANADCIRCTESSSLACTGDSTFSVITKCGQPDHTESSQIKISLDTWERVDTYYYDCGEGQFIRVLTFRAGKLISIETEGRGSGPTRCQ